MNVSRKRAGILTAETIVAIALVGFLLFLLASAVGRQRLASERLAASRDAVGLAERAITALQSGQPIPTAPAGALIKVMPVSSSSVTEKTKWVKVDVRLNGHETSLVGIVPSAAPLDGGQK